jgi:ketosteroid isomerase-like protein
VAAAFAGWALAWTPALTRSTASGDLGWSMGNALYTIVDNGAVVFQSPSKYLTVWARQPDGRWKFILDGGNSRPCLERKRRRRRESRGAPPRGVAFMRIMQ